MIPLFFPLNLASGQTVPGPTAFTPVWGHPNVGLRHRAFPPRTRGQDVWVERGSAWNDDPMADTRLSRG